MGSGLGSWVPRSWAQFVVHFWLWRWLNSADFYQDEGTEAQKSSRSSAAPRARPTLTKP